MPNEHFVPTRTNIEIANSYSRFMRRILHHEDTVRRLESALSAFDVRVKVAEKAIENSKDKSSQKSNVTSTLLARELLEKSSRILSIIKAEPEKDFVVPALAAIDYLVTENDGLPDFESEAGFNDDAAILNEIIDHFKIPV